MGLSTCSGHSSSFCGEVKAKDQYELNVDPMYTPRRGIDKSIHLERQRESRKLVMQLIKEQGVEVEDMSDRHIKKMEVLVQDMFVKQKQRYSVVEKPHKKGLI